MTPNVKETQKKYYKCVDKDLKSIVVYDKNPFCVQYKIGEWVEPNFAGTRLMVFDDEDRAKDFLNAWVGDVYECKVKNPQKSYKLLTNYNFYLTNEYCVMNYYDCVEEVQLYQIFLDIDKKVREHQPIKELVIQAQKIINDPALWGATKPIEGTIFCSAVKLVKKINMYP